MWLLGALGCWAVGQISDEDVGDGGAEAPEQVAGGWGASPPVTGDPPVDDVVDDLPPDETGAELLWGDGVPAFSLALDDDALAALAEDPRTDVPAFFEHEGHTWLVGVHLKGTWSYRSLDDKAAFKIDFGEYEGPSFHGVRRLTLNNMVQDPTMLREHATYWLHGALGAPAPRHGYATLAVNGEPYGLYGVVETMDEGFLTARWPGDDGGWLYESVRGSGDFTSGRVDNFQVQESGEGEAYADLERLVDALDEGRAAGDVRDTLEARFDGDALFAALAVDVAVGHADGYVFATNNFLAYHAPIADRWTLLPWGADQAFRTDNDPFVTGTDPMTGELLGPDGRLVQDCVAEAECEARLREALGDVAETWRSGAFDAAMRETAARIAVACDEDPRREHPCDPEDLFDFVQGRVGTVEGWAE